MTNRPVRESIREIDDNTWLIGEKILLSRRSGGGGAGGATDPLPEPTWADGNGGRFSISDAPDPLPETRPLSDTSDIKLVYDAGDVSAAFKVGEAFCKVRILDIPEVTREHVTLAWMHQQQQRSWSFAIPDVLYHAEHDGRYYLIVSQIPGGTLDSLWPTADESTRQHWVERITQICAELATIPIPDGSSSSSNSSSSISGVDGNYLTERYLSGQIKSCSPENLRKSCLDIGMDCSSLVFYHCDMGPTNIIIDPVNPGSIGIIDWETAGFVPREWIRTKYRVCSGMNLSTGDEVDFRRRVGNRLGELGYPDLGDQFMAWFGVDTSDEEDE